ncbi:fructose bisphosphate aldolase [Pseudopelagicola sp. nBUS_20]|uniref:fructose bisphosphate aldolase n=1 Tax=Pseudopelagicola sp. nBUS_20 TaxID=3395317 RepID=UPI003EBF5233
MSKQSQAEIISSGQGFIAALDQSGGSTPKALRLYGVEEDAYDGDEEMFDQIHAMRSRIAKAPAFSSDNIVGAILFEMTMDREIDDLPTATYMWEKCGVVPFLKVDKGLEDEADGVQLMKSMPQLDELISRALKKGIFGTKMRSVVNSANVEGIRAIVAQQFDIGQQILERGLVPILEPEVNINAVDKAAAENILLNEIKAKLNAMPDNQQVMLKLTLPNRPNHYLPLIQHPRVMQVVALSGGYSRNDANEKLAQNTGMIASFSRALTEGLKEQQTEEVFNAVIAASIDSIYQASIAG